MANSINPLGDRVVAQLEAAEAKTASGIILPENAKEKSKVAKVVAVGPAVKGIKVGDRIMYKEFSTTEVKMGKDEFIVVEEKDVLATVK